MTIPTRDEAVGQIEAAIKDWARVTDLYVPRIAQLAAAVYNDVVGPLAQQLATDGPLDMTGSPNGNTMYCATQDDHDTHIWTPPWEPMMQVRCPGRGGVEVI